MLSRKIQSFGDPRLYALSIMAQHLSNSKQPLVPERVFTAGSNGHNGDGHSESLAGQGMFGMLINLLVAEKAGFGPIDLAQAKALGEDAVQIAEEAPAHAADDGSVVSREYERCYLRRGP